MRTSLHDIPASDIQVGDEITDNYTGETITASSVQRDDINDLTTVNASSTWMNHERVVARRTR